MRPTPHFAAIATTICADASAQLAGVPVHATTLTELVRDTQRQLAIVRDELTQLGALTAPPALSQRFAAALAAGRAETAAIAALIGAIRTGDATRVATLALRARSVDARARSTMAALRLGECTRAAAARTR